MDSLPDSNPYIDQPQAAYQPTHKIEVRDGAQHGAAEQQAVLRPHPGPGKHRQKHSQFNAEHNENYQ